VLFKERKQSMLALLEALGHDDALREALAELKYLPAANYADSQWQILLHITHLLAQAVAQLNVVFQSRGEVDFTELSLSALRALGSELAPSDLMLRLDARIRHLLIDEFQDTSTTQFHLLERLVEGWREHNENELEQEHGGQPQTLFIVGDGMQSIYGFREAKVGLFLDARHNGVNQLELHDAPLTVNFRSTPTIVEWVNKTFKQAFPHSEHIARGAVPYEMCSAFNAQSNAAGASEVVVFGVRNDPERYAEAEQCVRLVQAALQRDTSGSVAILVRYRTHLRALVPALQRAGIAFRATDIDPLAQRAAIQDILALLKALLNPADRIAWLALLRSPLIGLDNIDLHRLVAGIDGGGTRSSVLTRLRDVSLQRQLSQGATQRVEFALRIIDAALAQRARKPLRVWLEGVWFALGGALSISDEAAWRDVQVLFDLVEKLAPDLDVAQLEERLRDLYARTAAPVTTRVLLMTIHKSKGLEFDTVILPGLDAGTRADDKPLLRWNEYLSASTHGSGDSALVLAAKSALGGADDATYDWLHYEHKQKQALEDTRLLYVAATRAIKNLYLLFTANGEDDYRGPASNCLLARIWPAVAEQVSWLQSPLIHSVSDNEIVESAPLWRAPLTWSEHVPLLQIVTPANNPLKKWAGDNIEAKIGTVIHRLLEQIIKYGSTAWLQRTAPAKGALVESMLLQLGVASAELAAACSIVGDCIDGMLSDERGRWMLNAELAESVAEWELMTAEGQRYVIDRSFVDGDGVRWIVDYKTSLPHADEALDDFLRRESAAHLPQLRMYRELIAQIDSRPIKVALYFPRVPHWLEIE
jgi:ATP-dependent helicase/nuclease subunit A